MCVLFQGFPDMDKVYYGDDELKTLSSQIKEEEAHGVNQSLNVTHVDQVWIRLIS